MVAKTVWFWFKRIGLFVLAFLILYVAASYLLSYIPVGADAGAEKKGDKRVFVSSNGVHLDMIFPLELVPPDLLTQLPHRASTTLLAIGWGDKGFYLDTPTWAELKASTAVRAMFLPSPTAVHVTEHRAVNRKWSYMDLTEEQLTELWAYVQASFKTDAAGKFDELKGEGYTELDRFYEAHGNYSCFVTCNTWVNSALKKIGVRTAIWTPLDKGVLRFLPTVEGE